jgi:serine protease Do
MRFKFLLLDSLSTVSFKHRCVLIALCLAFFISSTSANAQSSAVAIGPDFTEIVERADPAVVNIRTTEKARLRQQGPGGPGQDADPFEMFRWFFGPNVPGPQQRPQPPNPRNPRGGQEEVPRGVGSGFFITSDGFILTNHHVVEGAEDIYVTLTDRRELKAKVIGSDQRTDVALIKVEGSGFSRLAIGDPNKLRKGEWVIAIGSPFGLDSTVTAGVVSAKGRDTGDFLPFIQTDVAVNPGNSGGPLINSRGEVVGINSQIFTRSGGYQGVSFAIPIDEAIRVSDQLKATGRVARGKIGISLEDVSKDVADSLGLGKTQGALVTQVERNSPADKGGIQPGDIVLKFDGRAVEKSSDLRRMSGNTKPGTKVALQVWRQGATRDVNITLVEFEQERVASTRPDQPSKPKNDAKPNELGFVISDLTDARRAELKITGGVQVDDVDGVAARAGIRAGDILLSFNNQPIVSAKQFNETVSKADFKKPNVVLVRRGEVVNFVPLRPSR